MAANFSLAPSPKTVDGLLAVPIDIDTIDATLVFDGASQSALADVTITYTVGPTSGNPIFDLRQTISQAWLDGSSFPVANLDAHDFGGGALSELRVIESIQTAGSVHTLRLQYNLNLPQSQLGGAYLPAIDWTAGPKLRFVFGLSDLNAARYLEAWLPANLIFDQYTINIDLQIINTLAAHSVISNAQISNLGFNHWLLNFPARFTALSPLLEVRATDTLTFLTDSVTLPVSGKIITIEAWKTNSNATDLSAQINNIKSFLAANETDYGSYLHENRFVAFFNGGGMEYEGGTTTDYTALRHETFHSWFARGVKPSSQADGWWDEAYTTYHDNGANDAAPFDFAHAAIVLCSLNPWQRITPINAYSDGNSFWNGIAALLGISTLNSLMKEFYATYKGQPVSTQMMEEFLLSKSGNEQVVDAFHRFVYGFPDPSPAPDLWMKDDPAHAGADLWSGRFWDSPDLWIRNNDDDGTSHQAPEYGQDNWFYARVRNKSTSGTARHFVVTFNAKEYAGTEFIYPSDFLPSISAKAEFELGAGGTRIVKARWPRDKVPVQGTHVCMLASVISRSDHPGANKHVWEHNNLAQKNLTVVNMLPDTFIIIPFLVRNFTYPSQSGFFLELVRDKKIKEYDVSLVHQSEALLNSAKKQKLIALEKDIDLRKMGTQLLDCGGHIHESNQQVKSNLLTSNNPLAIFQRFPFAFCASFADGKSSAIPIAIGAYNQHLFGLKISVPRSAKHGQIIRTDLVQRNAKTKTIVGGIAVEIRVI